MFDCRFIFVKTKNDHIWQLTKREKYLICIQNIGDEEETLLKRLFLYSILMTSYEIKKEFEKKMIQGEFLRDLKGINLSLKRYRMTFV